MELIERYLQAVKFALPLPQQDDIVKELRDSILSQIEEQESSLGRPLNEDEQVELLKKLGRPTRLASRYRKEAYLIGPGLLPIYWKVLKPALGLAFLVQALASIASAAAGVPLSQSLSMLFHYPALALTVFAWVTIVFACADYFGAKFRFADHWDPRTLPPIIKDPFQQSRLELITKLVLQTIFGVWWLTGLHYPFLVFGPGAWFLTFGPVWHEIYPLFVAAVLVDIGFTLTMLYRPQWKEGARVARIVMNGFGVAVLSFLVKASNPFVASNSSVQSQSVANAVNFAAQMGFRVALVVIVICIGIDVARLIGRGIGRARQSMVGL